MNKQAIYRAIDNRADEVINKLYELTESKNPTVALGACRTLLERIIPPMRGVGILEVGHLDTRQRAETFKLLEDYRDSQAWSKTTSEDIEKALEPDENSRDNQSSKQ